MGSSPITLRFAGDQVATFSSVSDDGSNSIYSIDQTPFLSTDIIEITIDKDGYDNGDGEFDASLIEYTSIRVMRDGIWHDLSTSSGDKIDETGGSEIREQGDSFFTTNDTIGPTASSSPFDSIPTSKYVFTTDAPFTAGVDATLARTVDGDFNDDGDSNDIEEGGNANFNVNFALNNAYASDAIIIDIDNGNTDIRGGDYASDSDDTQYVILTDNGNINEIEFKGWGKDSPTQAGEGPGGDDEFHFNLRGFDDDFEIELASLDEGDTFFFTMVDSFTVESDLPNDVLVYTITYTGSDGLTHTVEIDLFSEVTDKFVGIDITLACFAKGSMIETYHGPCAVEDLDVGDLVLCGDGEHRIIQWIASRYISPDELQIHPEYRPIRFRRGSMGHNLPERDLVVSPQHRMLVTDWRAELMFAEDEVLVPAKYMVNDHSITADHVADDITYFHFMFDSHQTVVSNGILTESFHPGDMAVSGVDDAARDELYALFPSLKSHPESFGATCRPTLRAFEASALFAAV